MDVYQDRNLEQEFTSEGRCHPWTVMEADPSNRYYDLKHHPEFIRTKLEDVVAFPEGAAKEAFVSLLEWINGSGSTIESNDCALRPPAPSRSLGVNPKPLECRGRIVLLQRKLELNRPDGVWAFAHAVQDEIGRIDNDWHDACWGWSRFSHKFLELSEDQGGFCVTWSFWAWGIDEPETLASTERALRNMLAALKIRYSV